MISQGFEVVNEDGSLVAWLQQAQDRGLIEEGKILLEEGTMELYNQWISLETFTRKMEKQDEQ